MPDKGVALITGANQGMGLQIAKELAAKHLTVPIGSRNLARGKLAAKTIGGDARALQLDVTDRTSIAAAAERIEKELGRLDVLVNNAAISNTRMQQLGISLQEYAKITLPSNASLDEVRAVWEINVFGVLAVCQAMLPFLRAAPAAGIVDVSSGVGSMAQNSRVTREMLSKVTAQKPNRALFAERTARLYTQLGDHEAANSIYRHVPRRG